MDETTEDRDLINARHLFGYDHDGAYCCPCCDYGTCLLAETPAQSIPLANGMRLLVVIVNGEEYVTDRYVMVRRDALDLSEVPPPVDAEMPEMPLRVPDELKPPEGVALQPATTARCFDVALTVHAGTGGVLGPQILAGRDGTPVGWIQPDREGLSADDVEKARAAATLAGISTIAAVAVLAPVRAVTLLVNDPAPTAHSDGR